MELIIQPGGAVRCVYGEAINLASLGHLHITRASHVEPNDAGQWHADLRPVQGPVLGPFTHRSDALNAEATWLREQYF